MTGFFLPYGARPSEPVLGAPAIEARNVTVRYPGVATPTLTDTSCIVETGSRVALVGANGSGKSTLLKAIAGLLPFTGEIALFGLPHQRSRGRVAYLPQRAEIDWRFPITVERLVVTGRYARLGWLRRPGQNDREQARAALERTGMAAFADRQIGKLSGGQQQRVLLARALAQQAELLLLDEPFNHVDVETRGTVSSLLDELRAAGATIVVATHDLDRLERDFDAVLRLAGGRIVADDQRSAAWIG